ncbi:MAG: T9SS type A sorting domain-containing protein [Rhodothermales bacterium]|nr:T9SS type A sorting domain-containing protein [Rhodothermales bacterium]
MLHRVAFILFFLSLPCFTFGESFAQIAWERALGPLGGVPQVLLELADQSALLVGTQGGLFKSTDEGQTWSASNGTSPIEQVLDLDEFNGVLFMTGVDRKAGQIRILRSSDAGNTWDEVPGVSGLISPSEDPAARLAVGPAGMFIIGITPNDTWVSYRSTDNGQSWDGPLLSLGSLEFEDLYDITLTSAGTVVVGSSRQIRRSTDTGDTWDQVHGEASSFFAVDAGGTLYAARPGHAAIYSSSNDGLTWTQIYSGVSLLNVTGWVRSLAAGDAGEVYAGLDGDGVAGTDDDGASWALFNNGFAPGGFFDYEATTAVHKLDSGTLVAGFEDGLNANGSVAGVYYSFDGGASWATSNAGLTAVNLRSVLLHSTGDILCVDGTGERLLRSQDGGQNWSEFKSDFSLRKTREDVATGDLYLLADFALFRSTDRGGSWTELSRGTFNRITDVALTSAGSIIVGDQTGILRSTDGGQSWASVTEWRGDVLEISSSGSIIGLDSGGPGVIRSDDDGVTWTDSNDPGLVDRLGVAPNGDLYISRLGLGLYKSTDNGDTWSDATGDVPRGVSGTADVTVQLISFDANSIPYVATGYLDESDVGRHSLFTSVDGGISWQMQDTGFEEITWVNDLDFDPSGVAYAATSTSIYTSGSAVANERVAEVPGGFVLRQNYPNPFNPSTSITYDLAQPSDVTLNVYDVLGRKITQLASGIMPAGTHDVTFDATGLSSGIYLYDLQARNYFDAKRMVVVR